MRRPPLTLLLLLSACSLKTSQIAPGASDFPYSDDTDIVSRLSVVSGTDANTTCDDISYYADISANGRYVAFETSCENLGPPANGQNHIYVKDLVTGQIEAVSLSTEGVLGNDGSYNPSISGDGRYVAFESGASNLVSNDTNSETDIFLHDRKTGITKIISVSSAGVRGNYDSREADISADGSRIAYVSQADNLVAGDTNDSKDVFVYTIADGSTQQATLSSSGVQANSNDTYRASLSGDGRYVAFDAYANNLVADDTNEETDVFVRDLAKGLTYRVSVGPNGEEGDDNSEGPQLSYDGSLVVFYSAANNLVAEAESSNRYNIYMTDWRSGKTERISQTKAKVSGNGDSYDPSISGNGRQICFVSIASNLVSGDTNLVYDVICKDRETGSLRIASKSRSGELGNGYSERASLSYSGLDVVFPSYSSNLAETDTNGDEDVFVH